ncbi:general secretion pathway protein GspM [Lysobacter daejeonensis GH1-9]|uniref:General secretion pathway protein GspM n=1 Tax=Lysobacter daejeonensis GH1-9 TaxID=1385517 RepID=A0A0A0EYL7_9GAMM|nr:type II secretion system protein GspM [Lysobacter daejeonensis]KGM55163.1 general secretion pathway protein GspM [Lysobacter daejeonensis GH1-9]
MATPVPSTDRDRWLALGLLLAVLLVVYALFVHPWWTAPMLQLNERIAALQEREQRILAELKQAPEVARRLAEVTRRQSAMPGFLPEANAELATAGLIQQLERVVAEASPGNRSCAITNRSPLTGQATRERFNRVVVQVRLRCGNPELAQVLHSLESGTPRLFVNNLNVLAQRMYFAPGVRNPGEGGLDVSFDLYGYLPPSVEVSRAR